MKRILFDDIDRVVSELGNVVQATGGVFSLDDYLEMIGKMRIDFDDEGQPIFPLRIAHPQTATIIESKLQEWLRDAESRKRTECLIQAKKQEWYDRESNRKLVD